jgi:hypothetical protein
MPMYLVWHLRHHADPAHRWLRQQLERIVTPALEAAAQTCQGQAEARLAMVRRN